MTQKNLKDKWTKLRMVFHVFPINVAENYNYIYFYLNTRQADEIRVFSLKTPHQELSSIIK